MSERKSRDQERDKYKPEVVRRSKIQGSAPRELGASECGARYFLASSGVLREGSQLKSQVIKDSAGRFAVSLMCSALQVPTSVSCAWLERVDGPRAQANRRLLSQILETHRRPPCAYGSPRTPQGWPYLGDELTCTQAGR